MKSKTPSSVYIHIPFCAKKCHYCDFNTYVADGQPIDEYLKALAEEMKMTAEQYPSTIKTIFVGGGTPTVLNTKQMDYFLDSIRKAFRFDQHDIEFTMEANPGTTDPEKLKVMKIGGVNRLSFGVQSFHEPLLQRIGRIHGVNEVYESIQYAREAGIDNLSIDLMFGLPGQTVDLVNDSLDKALELNLPHYSLYSLKVEENTIFHAMYKRNQLVLPNEDEEFEMYRVIRERLMKAGYLHYEISNFAKPGFEGKHNITYWKNEPYFGIGAGAHGYVQQTRHMNVKGVQAYIDKAANGMLPRKESFSVPAKEAMEDFMMVGLRLLDGISEKDFFDQFGMHLNQVFGPVIQSLLDRGLLEKTDKGMKLTEQGLIFGNDVFAEFIGEAS